MHVKKDWDVVEEINRGNTIQRYIYTKQKQEVESRGKKQEMQELGFTMLNLDKGSNFSDKFQYKILCVKNMMLAPALKNHTYGDTERILVPKY